MADPVEPKNPLTSKLNILGMLQVASSVLALLVGSEVIQQYPKAVAVLVGRVWCRNDRAEVYDERSDQLVMWFE